MSDESGREQSIMIRGKALRAWPEELERLSLVAESVTPVQRRYLLHGLILGIASATAIAAIGE